MTSDRLFLDGGGHAREAGGTTLIDDADARGLDGTQFQDIATGALADGDDVVRLIDGATELPGIDLRIEPRIELRVAQEDEVVDGHHAADATATDAHG